VVSDVNEEKNTGCVGIGIKDHDEEVVEPADKCLPQTNHPYSWQHQTGNIKPYIERYGSKMAISLYEKMCCAWNRDGNFVLTVGVEMERWGIKWRGNCEQRVKCV
jgi:hypothetical protein